MEAFLYIRLFYGVKTYCDDFQNIWFLKPLYEVQRLSTFQWSGFIACALIGQNKGTLRSQNYSAAELGLQLAAAAVMPTWRENGI